MFHRAVCFAFDVCFIMLCVFHRDVCLIGLCVSCAVCFTMAMSVGSSPVHIHKTMRTKPYMPTHMDAQISKLISCTICSNRMNK